MEVCVRDLLGRYVDTEESLYFVFLLFFFYLFHFFLLASVVVNQKASTEADVMSKIEIDSILKYVPDKIGARDRGKIYDNDKLDYIF